MVQVREEFPHHQDGSLDLNAWLARLDLPFDGRTIQQAVDYSALLERDPDSIEQHWSGHSNRFQTGLEMAEMLAGLGLNEKALGAAILYRQVREQQCDLPDIQERFGDEVASLIDGVLRMATISQFNRDPTQSVLGQHEQQAENIRKMLVAMTDDVRIALIKLAERSCAIRAVKDDPVRSIAVAREVSNIYVPLAHRLGLGQIKWQLEDLSFRYLEPDTYRQIAALLQEKRVDRQHYIREVITELNKAIEASGIEAEVHGRAKHIYSIWRKMRAKNIDFERVYDIRAVRVLVDAVPACYAVLGIVHMLWRSIPDEFDDYIAKPKANGYRSLHTAVLGPGGKVLEVQIRTRQMHDEAELGVCAHWEYKSVDRSQTNSEAYEEKIAWFRQLLEWHDEVKGQMQSATPLGLDLSQSRIYVFTPEGHVVDLPQGATPLDFAYHIHTDVGHRCCGAKVNGRIVVLTYQLQTGEQVEIITGSQPAPSHDWLRKDPVYVKTSRARDKIRQWFKQQARSDNILTGRQLLEKEFKRLALTSVDYRRVAETLNFTSVDSLYAAAGAGDVTLGQVLGVVQNLLEGEENVFDLRLQKESRRPQDQGITIGGIGQMLTHLAGCCKPVPGDAILGYVTIGRGVTIHRQDCARVQALFEKDPERVLDAQWNKLSEHTYPVDIKIDAIDRQGLLNEISALLANEHCNVTGVNSVSDQQQNTVLLFMTLEVNGLHTLSRLLAKISLLPNIINVNRLSQH
ncbi:MAG: GTP diphosphokinase [Pseudomonadales bacterium]